MSIKLGPEHLLRAGELLFGDRWQSDMARVLNVDPRRVREWIAGERRTPPGIWTEVIARLRMRSEQGIAFAMELDRLRDSNSCTDSINAESRA